MLDDVFSGLDTSSEERIFSQLLGRNGMLRQLGATVILATHAAHRLSYADNIIAISAHGTLAEQGTFGHLMANNGYITGLAAHNRNENEAEDKPKAEATRLLKAVAGDDVARQNAAADLERPVGNWAVYKYYFESAGWRNVLVGAILIILYSVLLRFPGKSTPIALLAHAKI